MRNPICTRRRLVLLAITIVASVFASPFLWYRWTFPYGRSHSCDACLRKALYLYAKDHGGTFPAGEATPEASLSLLYPQYASAELLQGRTVPLDVVKARLKRGERLSPETCGWHYVEGLTLDDDPNLALLWGKVPLGHNGQRSLDGGQVVQFVSLENYIAGADWDDFLANQAKLYAARNRSSPRSRPSEWPELALQDRLPRVTRRHP